MIAALDAHYTDESSIATIAAVVFERWEAEHPFSKYGRDGVPELIATAETQCIWPLSLKTDDSYFRGLRGCHCFYTHS